MLYKEIVPAEFKVNVDKGTFQGYASVFGNEDSYGDIVKPGAFKKTIKEHVKRIKVLWQHWHPFGVPTVMQEDSKGLYTESKIALTTENKDRLILMKEGVVAEMSIGYDTIKSEIDDTDPEHKIRYLTELKLWEYSPVTWAANDLATVTGFKSVGESDTLLHTLNMMLKEGRVLSGKNKDLVVKAIAALTELVSATEPDTEDDSVNTQPGFAGDGKGKADDIEPTIIHSVLEITSPLEALASELRHDNLLKDFREFGRSITN